jgi:hypothetical protein
MSRSSAVNAGMHLGVLQFVIIGLAVATAAIHIFLAVTQMNNDLLFILNGLGYLVLVGALYLPLPQLAPYRNWIRWALIALAAITVVLWIIIGARTPIAYLDKAIEVALIVALWVEGQQRR